MPTGIIINVGAVVIGGLGGSILSGILSDSIKEHLNTVLGLCAFCMGISAVVLMKNMPAVVLAVILGSLAGYLLKITSTIQHGAQKLFGSVLKDAGQEKNDLMVTAVVLFCISGTGIYGSLDSGMTGNHSVLMAKAIMDFFTAMIFACQLGRITAFIGIPQFIIMYSLFLLAGLIVPMTTEVMIADFKACGGFILVATGLRMLKLKAFSVADMIPSMLFVMPISALWTNVILPLIG